MRSYTVLDFYVVFVPKLRGIKVAIDPEDGVYGTRELEREGSNLSAEIPEHGLSPPIVWCSL
jgi:hypothetical protein